MLGEFHVACRSLMQKGCKIIREMNNIITRVVLPFKESPIMDLKSSSSSILPEILSPSWAACKHQFCIYLSPPKVQSEPWPGLWKSCSWQMMDVPWHSQDLLDGPQQVGWCDDHWGGRNGQPNVKLNEILNLGSTVQTRKPKLEQCSYQCDFHFHCGSSVKPFPPKVTETEFLLTISVQYQADKW